VHLVGFTIQIYYDTRTYERQVFLSVCFCLFLIGLLLSESGTHRIFVAGKLNMKIFTPRFPNE
jgi:hypothetical protein